jgi:hypothetical protein
MTLDCDTWPVPTAGDCVGGCTIPADVDAAVLEAASIRAGVILRTLSGGRVGTCTDTLRPLSECVTCRGWCHCGSGDRIRLHSWDGPVTAVSEVWVNGTPIDGDSWRFYPSGQLLYRVPPDVWPNFDDKTADCGDGDTMCVDVSIGYPPDAWALAVHAELTCELVQSCLGLTCRIPKNASSVTAQGVTVTLTPTEAKQFIPAVSGWVAAVNPDNAQTIPRVYSPDLNCGNGGGGAQASTGPGTIDGGWA